MISLLLSLLVTTVVLKLAALVLPGLEIDDLTDAMFAAIVIILTGWAVFVLLGMVSRPAMGLAVYYGFILVVNAVALALAVLLVPGVRIRGVGSILVAVLLLTVTDLLIPYARAYLLSGL